ncbi:MAG: TRAP transporter substrate-binding protein DctP [Hyphomicrobiaceae bacterium]
MTRHWLAAVAALAVVMASGGWAEAKTTLRLTLQLPLQSVLGKNVQMFKEEVEAATNGEIEIQIFDSGQLYQDKDVPKAVGSGQIEMGVASLARYVGDVPAVDVFYIPALFDSDAKLRAAVAPGSPVRGPLDEAITKTGSRVLWWQAYGSTILLTKSEPIRTPAELSGKKVRVFGKLLGTWVTANGGAPVNVAGAEQYFAYQRGTVDVGMTGPDTIKSRKLWEVMNSVTLAGQAAIEFVVVINERAWSRLTPQQQGIIQAAALKAEADLRDGFAKIEADAIQAGRDNGMTIYEPTAEEAALWRASADAVRDEFLKGAGALGTQVYEAAAKLE